MYMYICKCICIIYWNKVYKTKQLYTVSISNSVVPFRARCIAVLKYSVYVLVTYKPVSQFCVTYFCNHFTRRHKMFLLDVEKALR